MPLIQLKTKAQITLPVKMRRKLGIKQGDYLEATLQGEKIILTPIKAVDRSEAWFWSKEWQEGERRADEDLKAGRYTVHDTMEDLVKSLRESVKKKSKCKS
jgi:antitoxin MazE